MKKGTTREFLETIAAQDAWIHYKDRFFFVNGCCCDWDRKTGKVVWARLEMYELDSDHGNAIAEVCSITKPTVREVIDEFVSIPLIDGKTFWELENELEWV